MQESQLDSQEACFHENEREFDLWIARIPGIQHADDDTLLGVQFQESSGNCLVVGLVSKTVVRYAVQLLSVHKNDEVHRARVTERHVVDSDLHVESAVPD